MLCNSLKEVIRVYPRAGLQPRLALMDGEFDKLIPLLSTIIEVNTTTKNEHVSEIKQKTRHMKVRSRAIKAAITFTILSNVVIKALVIHTVRWMNALPAKAGVSDDLSPREIVLCWQLNTKIHCRATFDSFCFV